MSRGNWSHKQIFTFALWVFGTRESLCHASVYKSPSFSLHSAVNKSRTRLTWVTKGEKMLIGTKVICLKTAQHEQLDKLDLGAITLRLRKELGWHSLENTESARLAVNI